jgi:hypothetical protein
LATRPPLNFGEAIIVIPGIEANEDQIGRFFQTFYNGLSREHRAWMPYIDEESRLPLLFNLADEALNKDNNLVMAIITPRAIIVNTFSSGMNTSLTYEFYANVIKPRDTITNRLD